MQASGIETPAQEGSQRPLDEFERLATRNSATRTQQTPFSISTNIPFIPKTPKMGGLTQTDNDKSIAWTGGKPNITWTQLDDGEIKEPTKPTQFRAIGSADIKSYTYRTTGLKSKFDKTADLETFCNSM